MLFMSCALVTVLKTLQKLQIPSSTSYTKYRCRKLWILFTDTRWKSSLEDKAKKCTWHLRYPQCPSKSFWQSFLRPTVTILSLQTTWKALLFLQNQASYMLFSHEMLIRQRTLAPARIMAILRYLAATRMRLRSTSKFHQYTWLTEYIMRRLIVKHTKYHKSQSSSMPWLQIVPYHFIWRDLEVD